MDNWNHSGYNESDAVNGNVGVTNVTIDTPEYLEMHSQLRIIFEGYGVTIAAILGIIMNTLSILVFLRPQMRATSINILLIGLQISDLIVVLTLLYISGFPILWKEWGYIYKEAPFPLRVYRSLYIYAVALSILGKFGSQFFTILVSLERYIAVCHPLKVQVLCSQRRAIIWSILVATISFVITLPHWLLLDWTTWYNIEIVLLIFLPFVVLVGLNIAIYIGYRRSKTAAQSLRSTQNDDDNSLTYLLFGIVVIYLICNSFFAIHYFSLILGLEENWFILIIIQPQSDFLNTVNSACNFVLYCAYGRRFRSELGKLLRNLVQIFLCDCGNAKSKSNAIPDTRFSRRPTVTNFGKEKSDRSSTTLMNLGE